MWSISQQLIQNMLAHEQQAADLISTNELIAVAVDAQGIKLNLTRASQMASLINSICPKYGITTWDILEEFLATVLHESDCFRRKTESTNYTHEEVILRTWPTRFKNLAAANLYVRQPEKLANFVYGGRLGNVQPGDGFAFRGCGYIQMTGRSICTEYWNYKRSTDPQNTPATVEDTVLKIRTDDGWALDSSCWTYCISKKLIKASIDDRFLDVTKAINGGTIGLPERQRYYKLIKQLRA